MMDYAKIEKQMSQKKHIIITGSRGSGKSTLLRALSSKIGEGKVLPGLVTWCEPGKAVYMSLLGSDDHICVGKFNPESKTRENRMLAVKDGFEVGGVACLLRLIADESEWITIDEIGYLETKSGDYIKKLDEAFDKKRVMAVVRKQELHHIYNIVNREDALVIDLDDEKR